MATTLKTSTRQPKELIAAPAISRATSKTGAFLGYGVPSDSQPGTTYHVTWNETSNTWRCNCPATKPCKHIKAVCEVCCERKALGKTEVCPCNAACEENKAVAAKVSVAQPVVATPATTATQSEIAAIFVSDAHAAAAVVAQQVAPVTAWVEMPNGTQRLPEQVGNAYLNALDAERVRFAAERERRNTAPLNGNRAFDLLRH